MMMMWPASKALAIVLAMSVLVAGLVAWALGPKSGTVAPGVTAAAIRRIELGMSEKQVVDVLGQPLKRIEPHYWGFSCVGDAGCRPVADEDHRVQLTYATEGPFLWVYLGDAGVSEVYAKRLVFFGADDEGIYGRSSTQPTWESPGFESAFAR